MIEQLEQLGYAVDHRVLNAADYGAPTSRERLFLVAQRDGQPIRWPAPTHGAAGQQPHRTVADCIDWSDLGRSIFGRTKDLAPATCTRIARGLQRQVLDAEQPFLVPTGARSAQEHPDAAYAFIAKHYSGVTGHGVQRPLGTITTRDHHSLVTAHTRPLGQDPTGEQRVAAFIMSYYSGGGTDAACSAPLPTIVTKARHALVCVDQRGQAITDIRMRMLKPEELQRAQGFPEHYRIARIGNSVCPPMAAALVAANCPALCQRG
jgi:DNA (cytosine-5)-methyltransferase 1